VAHVASSEEQAAHWQQNPNNATSDGQARILPYGSIVVLLTAKSLVGLFTSTGIDLRKYGYLWL